MISLACEIITQRQPIDVGLAEEHVGPLNRISRAPWRHGITAINPFPVKLVHGRKIRCMIQKRVPGNIENGTGEAFDWWRGESCPGRIFGCQWMWCRVRACNDAQSAKVVFCIDGMKEDDLLRGGGGLTTDSACSTKTSAIMRSFDASVFRRPMASRNTGSSFMAANASTLSRRTAPLLSSI